MCFQNNKFRLLNKNNHFQQSLASNCIHITDVCKAGKGFQNTNAQVVLSSRKAA